MLPFVLSSEHTVWQVFHLHWNWVNGLVCLWDNERDWKRSGKLSLPSPLFLQQNPNNVFLSHFLFLSLWVIVRSILCYQITEKYGQYLPWSVLFSFFFPSIAIIACLSSCLQFVNPEWFWFWELSGQSVARFNSLWPMGTSARFLALAVVDSHPKDILYKAFHRFCLCALH